MMTRRPRISTRCAPKRLAGELRELVAAAGYDVGKLVRSNHGAAGEEWLFHVYRSGEKPRLISRSGRASSWGSAPTAVVHFDPRTCSAYVSESGWVVPWADEEHALRREIDVLIRSI
jgi:hypothetical protein